MNIIQKIPYLIIAKFPPNLRDDIRGIKRFRGNRRIFPEKQLLIFQVDGTLHHGGLCDRFKGAVTMFHYALCKNIPFRINYVYPFELSDFLVPNKYNWLLGEDEKITDNMFEAKFMNVLNNGTIKQLTTLKTKRQIHVYINLDFVNLLNQHYNTSYEWGELFKILFKPTDELKKNVADYQEKIGGKYISIHLRFQNLLSDFEDNGTESLKENEKNELISKCRKEIAKIQDSNECKTMFVTSDSSLFLHSLKQIPKCCVFPQENIHIDADAEEKRDCSKLFIDFFLLSESEKIYSIGTKQMYNSDFPLYAAKLNNTPFERISIN